MVEKSAGAIIFTRHHFLEKPLVQKKGTKNGAGFRKESGKPLFLLLHYPSGSRTKKEYWDLPKGHIEKGENPEDTAKREVEEETGLKDIEFFYGFKETIKYFFKWEEKNILKFVTFYLAEAKTEKVKISSEHLGFKWLTYEEAMAKLTFKNAKEVLKEADDYLKLFKRSV